MPLALNRGDRRLLLFGSGIVLLLMAVTMFLAAGAGDRGEVTTTYSSASSGAKAAYLLLETLGYQVERWEDIPAALSAPDATTFVIAEPLEMPSDDDRDALHHFLEAGGRVIATGQIGALFLNGSAVPNPLGAPTWSKVPSIAPSATSRVAPEITLATRSWWVPNGSNALPLYGDTTLPLVVGIAVGRGEATWWAAPTPLTNAGLREPGNLEFLLASIGPRDGRRVVWDEYFHGRRRTLAASMWHSPAKWVGLQLTLVALVVLLTNSRRSGPIIVPPVESRLSPLEFVRTLGSLYARARAATVPVGVANRRLRHALADRFGVNARGTADDIAAIVAQRRRSTTPDLVSVLHQAEAAQANPSLGPAEALAVVQALGTQMKTLTSHRSSSKEDR
jgi:hypothetical protein